MTPIEVGGRRRQVVGIVIHVVAVTGLRGPAVPTAIVRDDAVALADVEARAVVLIAR